MSQLIQGQLEKYLLGALTTFLATFGGCLGTGCSKIKSIGLASDPPIVEIDAFGVKVKVRTVLVDFYPDEAETVEP